MTLLAHGFDEHTDQVDHGSAYFEPNEFYPLGGFKCQHGHCANRKVIDLHKHLNINRTEAKHKPIIYVQAGEIPRICDAAERVLAESLNYYQRSGMIVTIATDPGTHKTTIAALTLPRLTRAVADLAIWQRYDKRSESWVAIDPPEKYIRVLSDRPCKTFRTCKRWRNHQILEPLQSLRIYTIPIKT